jgi:TPR repeat protein
MAKLTLEDYRRQAEMGNPQALFDLACLYYWGRGVSKDVETAIALLRRLEMNAPEWAQWARFNIAKMKYYERDASLRDYTKPDCDAGFGPALYLMGVYSTREGGEIGSSEAIKYFRAAAQSGHAMSEFLLWKESKAGFWRRLATAIPAYLALLRFAAIGVRNEKDVRAWV